MKNFIINIILSLIFCIDLEKLHFNISLQTLKVKEFSKFKIYNILIDNSKNTYEFLKLKLSNFGNSTINEIFLSDNIKNNNFNNKNNVLNKLSPLIYYHKSELNKFNQNNLSDIFNMYLFIKCSYNCNFELEYQLIEQIDLHNNFFFFLNLI